ncbi:hypothetical protein CU098_005004, partial [Rhizopus stolonifer]
HYVTAAFDNVMAQLQKRHAQIRYSSLQLIEQLFERSKLFRKLLTEEFPQFTELLIGINSERLPPPPTVAEKLKRYALALIKNWHIKYGEKYRQIDISFTFLLDNGFINDDQSNNTLTSIHTENVVEANKSVRMKVIQANKYEMLKVDIDDNFDIIKDNLDTMEGCFDILVPKNTLRDGKDIDFEALLKGEITSKQATESDYKQVGSNRYKITIDLSEASMMDDVKETEDNSIIFDQLREAFTVMETKHSKEINNWISALIKIDVANKAEKEAHVKKLIDLKSRIAELSRKARLLGIQVTRREMGSTGLEEVDDEFEDEEFEEVDINEEAKSKKKQSSVKIPSLQRIFPLSDDPRMVEDPTYTTPQQAVDTKTTIKDKGKQKADIAREELLKVAPFVEWGDDLYYWDKDHVQFNTSGIERSHRFMGVGEGSNEIPGHVLDELRKRPVYYKPQTVNEIPACRHPLHSGGLCPRRDLVTCPFHGKIIPRDEIGRPCDPTSVSLNNEDPSVGATHNEDPFVGTSHSKSNQTTENLWELLEADVMSQTGQEKIVNRRGQKKKFAVKSALIDIKKKPDNSYARLQRKMNSVKNKRLIEEAVDYEREMKSRNREVGRWH